MTQQPASALSERYSEAHARQGLWARQWHAGWTYRQIGAVAGVDDRTVRRALAGRTGRVKRAPGPKPRAKPTTARVLAPTSARVLALYEGLQSARAVVATLGVSRMYVRAWCRCARGPEHLGRMILASMI